MILLILELITWGEGMFLQELEDKKPKKLACLPDNCVVVDIETTGFSAQYDSIIEISALKVVDNQVKEEFSTLVKPKRRISNFITKLTGITPQMVENAPEIDNALLNFCNFIQTNPIIGHNIRFDLSFLNCKMKECFNKTLLNDFADTLTFSKMVYKELNSHKLTSIASYLNIDTKNAHRALSDCYMTYKILIDIKEKL